MDYQLLSTNDREYLNVIAIDDEDLIISFHRTIRLPPGTETVPTALPNLGTFPVYAVEEYRSKWPDDVATEGGFFLPMREKEAMWIQFLSRRRYVVKVYAGDINVISGESVKETTAKTDGSSVQDHVVTPQQRWIDGITTTEKRTRQFVVGPTNLKYTAEVPISGSEAVPNLRFEIMKKKDILQDEIYVEFPRDTKTSILVDLEMDFRDFQNLIAQRLSLSEYDCIMKFQGTRCQGRTVAECGIGRGDTVQIIPPGSTISPDQSRFSITVTRLGGKVIPLKDVCSETEFIEVKEMLQKKEEIPSEDIRLIYLGRCLMDHKTLKEFDVKQDSNLHMVTRLRSTAKTLLPSTSTELAAGAREGLTKQPIVVPDTDPESWDASSRTAFNVHLLSASLFHSITDIQPPKCPIDRKTYSSLGIPPPCILR